MQYLYHYTKFDNLFPIDGKGGILQSTGLSLWAKYHSFFKNKEYEWIKDEALAATKELCTERKENFDANEDNIRPCIISFCLNGNSDFMWKRYANRDMGVQLVLDIDCVYNNIYQESVDIIEKCVYLKKHCAKRILKSILASKYELRPYITNKLQDDLTILAASLKQKHFKNEKEIRYIHSYPILAIFSSSGIDDINPLPPSTPKDATKDEFVVFRHQALRKIIVGTHVSDEAIRKITKRLKDCGFEDVQVLRR